MLLSLLHVSCSRSCCLWKLKEWITNVCRDIIQNVFSTTKLILYDFNLVSFKASRTISGPHCSFSQAICYARNIKTSPSVSCMRPPGTVQLFSVNLLHASSKVAQHLSQGSIWKLATHLQTYYKSVFIFIKIKVWKIWKAVMMQLKIPPVLQCCFLHTLLSPRMMHRSKPELEQSVSKATLQGLSHCLCCWKWRAWSCLYFKSRTLNSISKRSVLSDATKKEIHHAWVICVWVLNPKGVVAIFCNSVGMEKMIMNSAVVEQGWLLSSVLLKLPWFARRSCSRTCLCTLLLLSPNSSTAQDRGGMEGFQKSFLMSSASHTLFATEAGSDTACTNGISSWALALRS